MKGNHSSPRKGEWQHQLQARFNELNPFGTDSHRLAEKESLQEKEKEVNPAHVYVNVGQRMCRSVAAIARIKWRLLDSVRS